MTDVTPEQGKPGRLLDAPLRFDRPQRKMDLATLLGLIAALALIGIAITLNGSPLAFVDLPATLLVILGTVAVTVISYTGEELREASPTFRQALLRTETEPQAAARRVLLLADKARKRGMLQLQADLYGLRDVPFLQRSLGMLIDGQATDETDDKGKPIRGDTMLLLVNASEVDVDFTLPEGSWSAVVDTHCTPQSPNGSYAIKPFSLVLLSRGSSSTPRPT